MGFADPLLLLGNRKIGEELIASVRARRDVEDAAEDVGNFKSDETERHVSEARAFCWELLHVRSYICIEDIQRLVMY